MLNGKYSENFQNKLGEAEERVPGLKSKSLEMPVRQKQEEKRKTENNVESWDIVKQPNIFVLGVPKGIERMD